LGYHGFPSAGAPARAGFWFSTSKKETAMKTFHCGSLVPGCDWHTRADSEAEIVSRAIDHLRETHGETTIRPSIVEQIKERMLDETDAA
jgi:predicted small metal-binding protein